jgi:putative membrane protein
MKDLKNYFVNKLGFFEVRKFLIIYFTIGIIGFNIDFIREIFFFLTSFTLIISIFLTYIFYSEKITTLQYFLLIVIFLGTLGIEILGVNTGMFFGDYTYQIGLGPKFFGTPIIIGINWILVTYCSLCFCEKFVSNKIALILSSSAMVLVYDYVLEKVAPLIKMWYWKHDTVPVKNYISWLVISTIIITIYIVFKFNYKNRIARIIFYYQLIFFIILLITMSILS